IAQATWMYVTPSLPDWSYDVEAAQFVHNSSYTVRVRAVSNQGVAEWSPAPFGTDTVPPAPNTAVTFWIDNQSPVLTLAEPSKAFYKSFTTATGSVSDAPSGINSIEVSIRRTSDNHYWRVSDSSWTTQSVVWNSTSAWNGSAWSLALGAGIWEDGKTYAVKARAYDNTSPRNFSLTGEKTFIYDLSYPTATLSSPARDAVMSALPAITGAWAETSPGQISKVELIIQRSSDWNYWRDAAPAGWKLNSAWNAATVYSSPASSWSWTKSAGLTWENNTTYYLTVRAVDLADNTQGTYIVGQSSYSFFVDLEEPGMSMSYPAAGSAISPPAASFNFQGIITDNLAGGASVELQLTRVEGTSTYYWTGIQWSTDTATYFVDQDYIGGGTLSRNWLDPFANWNSDVAYTIKARGYDASLPQGNMSNWHNGGAGYDFVVDTTAPSSRINEPQNNAKVASLAAITGTALGDLSGVRAVYVSLQRTAGAGVTGSDYWSHYQNTWVAGSTWCPANVPQGAGVQTWSYAINPANLTDGTSYQVVSRAQDFALNYSTLYSTAAFLYDRSAPESAITKPDLAFYGPQNLLLTLSGTAADEPSGAALHAKIDRVFVRINRTPPGNEYWSGTGGWAVNSSTWLVVNGTSPWTCGALSWEDGRIYTVNSRAIDFAGNLSGWTTASFRWDETLPRAGLLAPGAAWVSALATISGTAYDWPSVSDNKSGLERVEVAYQRLDNKQWYRIGEGFNQGTTEWITAANYTDEPSTVTWIVPDASTPTWANGVSYLVKSRSFDRSGNESIHSDLNFTLDQTPPAAGISLPFQTSHNLLPTISGTANDTAGAAAGSVGYVQVRIYDQTVPRYYSRSADAFSIDPSQPETAWFVATNTCTWEVWYSTFTKWISGRTYRVNARVRDNAGLWSTSYSTRTFLYDVLPPKIAVTKPFNGEYWNTLGTISGTAQDMPFPGSNSGTGYRYLAVHENAGKTLSEGWYDGGGFNDASPELNKIGLTDMPADGVWTYDASAMGLQSGASYYLTNKAFDIGGNEETWYNINGSTFVFDTHAPDAQITVPSSPERFYSFLSTLSGTSVDVTPAASLPLKAGVKAVYFTAQDVTPGTAENGFYWQNPSSVWGAGASTWTATTLDNWTNWYSTDVPSAQWKQGHRYHVRTWGVDNTKPDPGNVQAPVGGYFKFDSSAPAASFVSPANNQFYPSLSQITGTAMDYPAAPLYRSGIQKVEVLIKRNADNAFWNGSWGGEPASWPAATLTGDPQGAISYSYSALPAWESGKTYSISVRAVDNINVTGSSVTYTVRIDTHLPVSVVSRPTEDTGYSNADPLTEIQGSSRDYYEGTGFGYSGIDPNGIKLSVRLDEAPLDSDITHGPAAASASDKWWDFANSTWVAYNYYG
ncbi:MAG: hypothetical protein ACYC5N_09690, partial [Endomicrobiales bacterium]